MQDNVISSLVNQPVISFFFFFFQSGNIILKRVEQQALSAFDIVTGSRKILETVENQLETSEIILIHWRIFSLDFGKTAFHLLTVD